MKFKQLIFFISIYKKVFLRVFFIILMMACLAPLCISFIDIEKNNDVTIYVSLISTSITLSIFLYGAISPMLNMGIANYREQYNIVLRNRIWNKGIPFLLGQTILINAILSLLGINRGTNIVQSSMAISLTILIYFIVICWVWTLFGFRRIHEVVNKQMMRIDNFIRCVRHNEEISASERRYLINELDAFLSFTPETLNQVKEIGLFNKNLLFNHWNFVVSITSKNKIMFERFKVGLNDRKAILLKISKNNSIEFSSTEIQTTIDKFINGFIEHLTSSTQEDRNYLFKEMTKHENINKNRYTFQTLRFLMKIINSIDSSEESVSFFYVNFSEFLKQIASLLSWADEKPNDITNIRALKNIGINLSSYNDETFWMVKRMLNDKKFVDNKTWWTSLHNIYATVITQASYQFEYFLLQYQGEFIKAIMKTVNGPAKTIAIINLKKIVNFIESNNEATMKNDVIKADCKQHLSKNFNNLIKKITELEINNIDFSKISFEIYNHDKEEVSLALIEIIIKNKMFSKFEYAFYGLYEFLIDRLTFVGKRSLVNNSAAYEPAISLSHIISPLIQVTRFWLASGEYTEENLADIKSKMKHVMLFEKDIFNQYRSGGVGIGIHNALIDEFNINYFDETVMRNKEYLDLRDGITEKIEKELIEKRWL